MRVIVVIGSVIITIACVIACLSFLVVQVTLLMGLGGGNSWEGMRFSWLFVLLLCLQGLGLSIWAIARERQVLLIAGCAVVGALAFVTAVRSVPEPVRWEKQQIGWGLVKMPSERAAPYGLSIVLLFVAASSAKYGILRQMCNRKKVSQRGSR